MGFLGVFMMNWCGLPVFQYPNDVWLVTGIVVFFIFWFLPDEREKKTVIEKIILLCVVATISYIFSHGVVFIIDGKI